jgi:hypothetical protein
MRACSVRFVKNDRSECGFARARPSSKQRRLPVGFLDLGEQ